MQKRLEVLLVLIGLIGLGGWILLNGAPPAGARQLFSVSPVTVMQRAPGVPAEPFRVYLPLVQSQGVLSSFLIGVYAPGRNWGNQQDVNQYLLDVDAWAGLARSAGQGHSLAGDFIDFQIPDVNHSVPLILETLWANGYTDFVNLSTNTTASAIASGQLDSVIRAWARAYKSWTAQGGNRKAFIAPLQEMNGYWVAYGKDPANFKMAYRRIVSLFESEGVTRSQVWWVFAPNGYSEPPYRLQDYYPGDDVVDVIAFSAYNFGRCPVTSWTWWQEPAEAFGPPLAEIRQTVSRAKPIFIAETGSDPRGGDKDAWLRSAYAYLVQNNVRGILYFNGDDTYCQWAVYIPGSRQSQGYKDAVQASHFRYIAPANLAITRILP